MPSTTNNSRRFDFTQPPSLKTVGLAKITAWSLVALGVLMLIAGYCISQPTLKKSLPVNRMADTARLEETVRKLSTDFHPRNWTEKENLKKTSAYIFEQFKAAGGSPEFQEFEVDKQTYRNVRCIFNKGTGSRIVIGAHYDTCGDTPGADDNASGVAGLIELARLVAGDKALGEIELVSYPLEEPPFFGTDKMGSCFHAQTLVDHQTDVLGVIVLEMIGYFNDRPGSQAAPAFFLKPFYPNRGNFIAVAGCFGQRAFTKKVKIGMKGATDLNVVSMNSPRELQGIDFSDHRNYWPHGFNAVMVTDTAFYRNKAYHLDGDTCERLDYKRMGDTVLGIYSALKQLRN